MPVRVEGRQMNRLATRIVLGLIVAYLALGAVAGFAEVAAVVKTAMGVP